MLSTTGLRPGDRLPMSWEDYDQLDESVAGEYIDGALVVSPAPIPRHQRICRNLERIVYEMLPAGLEVLSHIGWRTGGDEFIPDVVVYDTDDEGPKYLTGAPHLVVEVLSSDRTADTIRKHRKYAEAGAPRYWIIDPEGPEVIVYHLVEGRYLETTRHQAGTEVSFDLGPVEISFDPAWLGR